MALLLIEGFDNIANSTDALAKGWTQSISGWPAFGTTGKRIYGNGCHFDLNTKGLKRVLPGSYSTVVIGAAVYVITPGSSDDNTLLTFNEGGTHHLSVMWDFATNRLTVRRGSTATLVGTSSASFPRSTWLYLEFKATIHDTTGSYEVRVNGVNVLSASNVDTRNGGTSGVIDMIQLGTTTGTATYGPVMYMDDVYVCDTSGSLNNDFLGDVAVQTIYPTSDSSVAWTRSTGGTSYTLVDEATQNGDTDYVESSTATQQDIYGFQDLAAITNTVKGVQINTVAKKTDAGSRSIKLLTKSGGTTYASSSIPLSAASYAFQQQIRETDPNTSSAWTESGVNSAEFGVECV